MCFIFHLWACSWGCWGWVGWHGCPNQIWCQFQCIPSHDPRTVRCWDCTGLRGCPCPPGFQSPSIPCGTRNLANFLHLLFCSYPELLMMSDRRQWLRVEVSRVWVNNAERCSAWNFMWIACARSALSRVCYNPQCACARKFIMAACLAWLPYGTPYRKGVRAPSWRSVENQWWSGQDRAPFCCRLSLDIVSFTTFLCNWYKSRSG